MEKKTDSDNARLILIGQIKYGSILSNEIKRDVELYNYKLNSDMIKRKIEYLRNLHEEIKIDHKKDEMIKYKYDEYMNFPIYVERHISDLLLYIKDNISYITLVNGNDKKKFCELIDKIILYYDVIFDKLNKDS